MFRGWKRKEKKGGAESPGGALRRLERLNIDTRRDHEGSRSTAIGENMFAALSTAQLGAALKLDLPLSQPDEAHCADEFSLCSSISDPLTLLRPFIRLHFPALISCTGVPRCRCVRNKTSSLLLPSVPKWDEVKLRYMSRFVG